MGYFLASNNFLQKVILRNQCSTISSERKSILPESLFLKIRKSPIPSNSQTFPSKQTSTSIDKTKSFHREQMSLVFIVSVKWLHQIIARAPRKLKPVVRTSSLRIRTLKNKQKREKN